MFDFEFNRVISSSVGLDIEIELIGGFNSSNIVKEDSCVEVNENSSTGKEKTEDLSYME